MGKIKRKVPPPYFYSGEHETKNENERETFDVYNSTQREQMLEDDEMTAAEEGFMCGREQEPSKKETQRNAISHDDSTSVELAKEDSEDD
ncbi:MAG: hypothetical protein FWG55_08695 [Candidatus Bathyarchaeota archaeon]|nr:hypothetical protein [Candidatus Termiticorpusculum sp.]